MAENCDKATICDLPDLPFGQILTYLGNTDIGRLRRISCLKEKVDNVVIYESAVVNNYWNPSSQGAILKRIRQLQIDHLISNYRQLELAYPHLVEIIKFQGLCSPGFIRTTLHNATNLKELLVSSLSLPEDHQNMAQWTLDNLFAKLKTLKIVRIMPEAIVPTFADTDRRNIVDVQLYPLAVRQLLAVNRRLDVLSSLELSFSNMTFAIINNLLNCSVFPFIKLHTLTVKEIILEFPILEENDEQQQVAPPDHNLIEVDLQQQQAKYDCVSLYNEAIFASNKDNNNNGAIPIEKIQKLFLHLPHIAVIRFVLEFIRPYNRRMNIGALELININSTAPFQTISTEGIFASVNRELAKFISINSATLVDVKLRHILSSSVPFPHMGITLPNLNALSILGLGRNVQQPNGLVHLDFNNIAIPSAVRLSIGNSTISSVQAMQDMLNTCANLVSIRLFNLQFVDGQQLNAAFFTILRALPSLRFIEIQYECLSFASADVLYYTLYNIFTMSIIGVRDGWLVIMV